MYLNESDLKEACKELLSDFDGVLSWKWDKNFEALLAEFSVKDQEEISSILERHLSLKWDKDTFRKAPDIIKRNAGHLGDLHKGQMLFTSDSEENMLILAAWWPWGDGEVVSLRIASPDTESPVSEKTGVLTRIKGFFR